MHTCSTGRVGGLCPAGRQASWYHSEILPHPQEQYPFSFLHLDVWYRYDLAWYEKILKRCKALAVWNRASYIFQCKFNHSLRSVSFKITLKPVFLLFISYSFKLPPPSYPLHIRIRNSPSIWQNLFLIHLLTNQTLMYWESFAVYWRVAYSLLTRSRNHGLYRLAVST